MAPRTDSEIKAISKAHRTMQSTLLLPPLLELENRIADYTLAKVVEFLFAYCIIHATVGQKTCFSSHNRLNPHAKEEDHKTS